MTHLTLKSLLFDLGLHVPQTKSQKIRKHNLQWRMVDFSIFTKSLKINYLKAEYGAQNPNSLTILWLFIGLHVGFKQRQMAHVQTDL